MKMFLIVITVLSMIFAFISSEHERSIAANDDNEYYIAQAGDEIMAHDYIVFSDTIAYVAERRAGAPIHGISAQHADTGQLCKVLIRGHVDYTSGGGK